MELPKARNILSKTENKRQIILQIGDKYAFVQTACKTSFL